MLAGEIHLGIVSPFLFFKLLTLDELPKEVDVAGKEVQVLSSGTVCL